MLKIIFVFVSDCLIVLTFMNRCLTFVTVKFVFPISTTDLDISLVKRLSGTSFYMTHNFKCYCTIVKYYVS